MLGPVLDASSSPRKRSVSLECRTKKMSRGTGRYNRQSKGGGKDNERGKMGDRERDGGEGEISWSTQARKYKGRIVWAKSEGRGKARQSSFHLGNFHCRKLSAELPLNVQPHGTLW